MSILLIRISDVCCDLAIFCRMFVVWCVGDLERRCDKMLRRWHHPHPGGRSLISQLKSGCRAAKYWYRISSITKLYIYVHMCTDGAQRAFIEVHINMFLCVLAAAAAATALIARERRVFIFNVRLHQQKRHFCVLVCVCMPPVREFMLKLSLCHHL
jgi:hypothetical protein